MTEKPQNSRQFLVTPSTQNSKQPKHKHRGSEMVPNEKKHLLLSLFKQGKHGEVFTNCMKLKNRYPNDLELLNLLGIAAVQISNLYQAQKAFQKIIKLDAKNSQAYNNLGNVLRQKGDFNCIKAYKKAIKTNYSFAEAHNNLGAALLTKGDMAEAVHSFILATEINSNFHDAFYNLGTAHRYNGDLIASEKAYTSAIKTASGSSASHNGLGLTLYLQGKLHEALKKFEQVTTIEPSNAEAHCNRGRTHYSLGDISAARDAYFHALSVDKNYFQAANRLMAMDFGTVDLQEVERCISILQVREQDDENAEYLFFKANIEKHLGQISKAFRILQKANNIKKLQTQQRYEASEYDYREAKTRIENWHPIHQDPSPNSINTICILGPSISGKSTLEKLLMPTPGLIPLFESIKIDKFQKMTARKLTFNDLFYYSEAELLKRGTKFVTSTSPATIFHADLLLDTLQNSYCVFVDRDPLDLGSEIFQKNYKSGNSYAYDPLQIQKFLTLYSQLRDTLTTKLPSRCLCISFEDLHNNKPKVLLKLQQMISPELVINNTKRTKEPYTTSQFRDRYKGLLQQNGFFA